MPLTNCIVIKVVILCDDDDVAWIYPSLHPAPYELRGIKARSDAISHISLGFCV